MKFQVILLLLLCSLNSFAETSCENQEIEHLPDGVEKMEAIYKCSKSIYVDFPKEAMQNVERLRELAQKLNNQFWLGKAHAFLGVIQEQEGYLGSAVLNYKKAIDIFLPLEKPLYLADNLANLGAVYLTAKEYKNALSHFSKALTTYEAFDDKKQASTTMRNIGLCYAELGNFNMAFDFYEQSLKFEKAFADVEAMSKLYIKLGDLYTKLKNYKEARNYFLKAVQLEGLANVAMQKAVAYNNLGETFTDEGDHIQAEEWLNKALELKSQSNDTRSTMVTLNNLAKVKFRTGDYERAVYLFNEALEKTQKGIIYPNSNENAIILDSALHLAIERNAKAKDKYFHIYSRTVLFQAEQNGLLADLKDKLETIMVQNQIKINLEIPELNAKVKEVTRQMNYREIVAWSLAFVLLVASYFLYKIGRPFYRTNQILKANRKVFES